MYQNNMDMSVGHVWPNLDTCVRHVSDMTQLYDEIVHAT